MTKSQFIDEVMRFVHKGDWLYIHVYRPFHRRNHYHVKAYCSAVCFPCGPDGQSSCFRHIDSAESAASALEKAAKYKRWADEVIDPKIVKKQA